VAVERISRITVEEDPAVDQVDKDISSALRGGGAKWKVS
jgi:hypothetical protein